MAFKVSRRTFLQSTGLAALALPLSRAVASETSLEPAPLEAPGTFQEEKVTGGVCEMCFWRCQLMARKRGDRLVKLEGNPKSIDNGASICARGNAGTQLLYDPDRLKYPLKNIGKRGAPKWKRISWQEALDECGSRLNAIKEKYGAKGLAIFPHGAHAKYPMHFFERVVGTPNVSEASFFQCRGIRDTAYLATIAIPPNENVDMANAKVILLLGCHFGENIHVSHIKRYIQGLQNGAKLIVVDPRYSASAAKSNLWVKIKPGTDTAFLLAIMNYLIEQKKYAVDFVEEYGDGLEELAKNAKEWTLEKAAAECDVPAEQIKEVAELLAANAPNVSIHPGRHVSWYGSDFQRERALACLTGLLGAFFVPGGFVPPKGPKIGKKSWPHVAEDVEETSLNLNEEEEHIYPWSPPGTPTDLIRDAALSGSPYPIKGCVIWGQNAIQTIPDEAKTEQMLQQMDFVMCVDVMPTDITMWADILLPETIYLERYDTIKTGTQWNFADPHQQYIAPRMPLSKPLFEVKDSIFITNEIAKRMGYGEHIPFQSAEEMVNINLKPTGLTLDQIRKEDGIHLQPGKDPYVMPEDFEVLFYNEDLADAGFPGAPQYIPVEQPPSGFTRLVYGRVPVHTFTRTQNNAWLHASMPVNPVWLNDELAAKMGLADGDEVGLVNAEGVASRTTTIVKTTPGIRKDCVFMAHGYGLNSPMMSKGYKSGIDDMNLISKVAVDPETGAHGMRNNFVKFVKDGKTIDIPA